MYDNEDCLLIVDMTLKDKRKSHIHHGDTIEENFWQAAKKMGKALTDCRKTKKKKKMEGAFWMTMFCSINTGNEKSIRCKISTFWRPVCQAAHTYVLKKEYSKSYSLMP